LPWRTGESEQARKMASNKKSDRDMTHLKKTANLVEEPMRIRLDDVLNRFQQDAAMTGERD
jgi:hypothetical protein